MKTLGHTQAQLMLIAHCLLQAAMVSPIALELIFILLNLYQQAVPVMEQNVQLEAVRSTQTHGEGSKHNSITRHTLNIFHCLL